MKTVFDTRNPYCNTAKGIYISKDQAEFLLPSVFQVSCWKSIWQISARSLSWHKVEGLALAFMPSSILTDIWTGIGNDFHDILCIQHQNFSNSILTKLIVSFILKQERDCLLSGEILLVFGWVLQKVNI